MPLKCRTNIAGDILKVETTLALHSLEKSDAKMSYTVPCTFQSSAKSIERATCVRER